MDDKMVYVTTSPMECYGNQTATYVPSAGEYMVLSANSEYNQMFRCRDSYVWNKT